MGRIGLRDYPLKSAEETLAFGAFIAKHIEKNTILALTGNLGAGKTTFVQGLAQGLGILEPIQSPTFILLNVYEGLAHFDLYRLKNAEDFRSLGFEEYFDQMICAIEWPDRIQELLPSKTIHIHFEYDQGGRTAKVL
ncbi:MAG: tRNA (adenosine(37)-N6)-threonylcarbamoyltransferase complex ATPase subunit type 1 TsaE [Parachlamydiales bacterium]|nr:tRNA (adenosine(37)-N6)-threonylcarbamoyltransferase complex ATPase subunit type 1 TsaE [Parachlamydiales bacterium]